MKQTLFAISIFLGFSAFAQPFAIGHRTLSLLDVARNRNVTAEVYYPAVSTGDNVEFANGSFPVFTLAHGFLIPGNTYQNFADALVPDGLVIVLPTTEGGILPNHDAFGKDIAFLNTAFRTGAVNFFTQWNGRSAIGGHSMGGGASALAATQTDADAYVGIAPAITNPSPVPQGSQVQIPAIIFSGSADGVTPPETNHQPIYDSFNSTCKTFVSITSGTHCFYIPSSLCDIGEVGAGGDITREIQQDITFDFLKPFLQVFLLDDTAQWQAFQEALPTDDRITYQQDCNLSFTAIESPEASIARAFPQPCINEFRLRFSSPQKCQSLTLYSIDGRKMSHAISFTQNANEVIVSLPTDVASGVFILSVETDQGFLQTRILKAD
jgi:hypothetical protein